MVNKKGLSPIIATVLLILITIAAVTILAAFIVPWVRGTLNSSTDCMAYEKYFEFKDNQYNCYNASGYHFVSVESVSDSQMDDKIVGLQLIFNKDSSIVKEIKAGNTGSCEMGGIGVKSGSECETMLKVPHSGEMITYVYVGDKSDSVDVAPIIKSASGSERVCGKSDSIKLNLCNLS